MNKYLISVYVGHCDEIRYRKEIELNFTPSRKDEIWFNCNDGECSWLLVVEKVSFWIPEGITEVVCNFWEDTDEPLIKYGFIKGDLVPDAAKVKGKTQA